MRHECDALGGAEGRYGEAELAIWRDDEGWVLGVRYDGSTLDAFPAGFCPFCGDDLDAAEDPYEPLHLREAR